MEADPWKPPRPAVYLASNAEAPEVRLMFAGERMVTMRWKVHHVISRI